MFLDAREAKPYLEAPTAGGEPSRLVSRFANPVNHVSRWEHMKKLSILWSTLVLVSAATACTKTPVSPTTTEPTSSNTASVGSLAVSLTIPQLVTPTDGQKVSFGDQPLKLTVKNAVSTGTGALSYTFQVASDAAFAAIVYTKDGVAPGSGDQTTLAIDKLAGNKSYFWRVRAVNGNQPGPFAKARPFSVGPEVVLQTPIPASPGQNGTAFAPTTLTVNNVQRSGPTGPIVYRFEVSDSSTFGNILFAGTSPEGAGGRTSIAVTAPLTNGSTYYWRVQASDPANGVTTPYSTVFSFVVQSFNFAQAVIWDNPADLALWPETSRVTSVEFTPYAFKVEFDKRTGPARWPDVVPPGFAGALQYTLGMCLNINNQWNCSAVVQFWYGRDLGASGVPSDIGFEWFYNPARWGPMTFHQPAEGEMIGLFAAAGDLRGRHFTRETCPRVCERTNVVLIPFPARGASAYFPF